MIKYIFQFYEGSILAWVTLAMVFFVCNPSEFIKFFDDAKNLSKFKHKKIKKSLIRGD